MNSRIPRTPRLPDGRSRRRSFWWGVLVAATVIGGVWFAFTVYLNWTLGGGTGGRHVRYSGGRLSNGYTTTCAPKERVAVTVDGRTETVTPEKPGIWKFTDRTVAWNCGYRTRSFACYEGTEYLIVIRHPNSEVLSLRCEIFEAPEWAETLPPDDPAS